MKVKKLKNKNQKLPLLQNKSTVLLVLLLVSTLVLTYLYAESMVRQKASEQIQADMFVSQSRLAHLQSHNNLSYDLESNDLLLPQMKLRANFDAEVYDTLKMKSWHFDDEDTASIVSSELTFLANNPKRCGQLYSITATNDEKMEADFKKRLEDGRTFILTDNNSEECDSILKSEESKKIRKFLESLESY